MLLPLLLGTSTEEGRYAVFAVWNSSNHTILAGRAATVHMNMGMGNGDRRKDHGWCIVKGEVISRIALKAPYTCKIHPQAKPLGRYQLKTLDQIYSAGTCFQERLGRKKWRGNEKHPCRGQM